MQLIQGIASDVTAKAKDAPGPAALLFKVDGKPVRIEQPDNDDKENASDEDRVEALSVRDGDSVIVAGDEVKGVFSGLACKNLTQGQATYRVPASHEWFSAWLFLSFAFAMFWLNALPEEREDPLYPKIPWLIVTIGVMSALFGVLGLFLIVRNHLAAFRVDWAALETVTGVVSGFRRLEDQKGSEGLVQAEIAGRRVLLSSRFITFENGDVLAVTGQQMPHGLRGFAYRNVTRSPGGKNWDVASLFWDVADLFFACFWPSVFLVLLAVFFLGGDLHNPWDLLGSAFAIALMMTSAIIILDRYYEWRLYREAYRRMEQACVDLAKSKF